MVSHLCLRNIASMATTYRVLGVDEESGNLVVEDTTGGVSRSNTEERNNVSKKTADGGGRCEVIPGRIASVASDSAAAPPTSTTFREPSSSWNISAEIALRQALSAKEAGNKSFKNSDAGKAVKMYRHGIDLLTKMLTEDAWHKASAETGIERQRANLLATLLSNLATCHYMSKRWTDVERCASACLEIDPACTKARYRRAMALHRRELHERAIADFEKLMMIAEEEFPDPSDESSPRKVPLGKKSLRLVRGAYRKSLRAVEASQKRCDDTFRKAFAKTKLLTKKN
eukprot:g5051.t1